jgi:hypothetical protein
MRILFAIPHYVRPPGEADPTGRIHGALLAGADPRVEALTACLTALHALFSPQRCLIDHERRIAIVSPAAVPHILDIVLCTTRDHHALDRLSAASRYYTHRETDAEPQLLGFACHDVLGERLGQYDYYC